MSTTITTTTEQPLDPRWDQAREVSAQLRLCGRLFLRGQVKLGMILASLKRDHCQIGAGRPRKNSPDSGELIPWADLVKGQTGYSRQSCDEFIRLYEATKAKLKTSKNLNLPAPVKQDAVVLFQSDDPLTLTDTQWALVDELIGPLTTGETQGSLMQELGLVPKPRPMPKGGGPRDKGQEPTAGQLAFHFFDAVAAPLINARSNPDYKKLLYALPFESDAENPLSLSTLEAEARALIADIAEVREKTAKPKPGRIINA